MASPHDGMILDSMPWGVVLVDRGRRIRYANAQAATLLGSTAEALDGAPIDAILGFDAHGEIAVDLDAALTPEGCPAPSRIVPRPEDAHLDALRVFVRRTSDAGLAAVWIESLGPFADEERASVALERCLRVVSEVRHAVNNSLMGIFGHADMLAAGEEIPETVRDRAEALLEEARQVRDRVQRLNDLRRGSL